MLELLKTSVRIWSSLGGRGRREVEPVYGDEEAWVRKKRDGRRDRVYLWIDRRVSYEIDSSLGK